MSFVAIEAERKFSEVIDCLSEFGVRKHAPRQTQHKMLSILESTNPDRLALVTSHCPDVTKLSQHEFMDKFLAIDAMFTFNGRTYAADVGSGKASTLVNKRRKMLSLEPVYRLLGIDHAVVVRINKPIDDDVLMELLMKLNNPTDFVVEIRL